MNWEDVEYNLYRAAVPGGWLIKAVNPVVAYDPRNGEILNLAPYGHTNDSITFVPDVNHEWRLA